MLIFGGKVNLTGLVCSLKDASCAWFKFLGSCFFTEDSPINVSWLHNQIKVDVTAKSAHAGHPQEKLPIQLQRSVTAESSAPKLEGI